MKKLNLSLLSFIVPRYCNFNCAFCGVKKYKKVKKSLSLSLAKEILEVAAKNNVKKFTISGGGEPFLFFNDVIKMIEIAHEKRMQTIITTNGSFFINKGIGNSIKKLKKAGLDFLRISIDYYHLKFISLDVLINIIKEAMNSNIRVILKVASNKNITNKNKLLLEKIAKKLKGKLITIIPFMGMRGLSVIIIKNKIIQIIIEKIIVNKENYKFINDKQIEHKNLAFQACKYDAPNALIVDGDYNILPCCSFTSINMPHLYSICKITNPIKDVFKKSSSMIKEITSDKYKFLNIYLKIQKNEKLKKEFLNEKYFSECDFCSWIIEHRYEIEKIDEPSRIEMLLFILLNFNILLKERLIYSYFMFFNIALTALERLKKSFNIFW
jgi:MoaA/NifB/PqqE/SkfB family radical SAM enzyme